MFAPAVLPFQITFAVTLFLSLVVFLVLRRMTSRPLRAAGWTSAFAAVSFFPTLFAVGAVVDSMRYGEFQFANGSDIEDPYVEIPASATQITLHKYASGHELKFTVAPQELQAWMKAVTAKRPKHLDATPFEYETVEQPWQQNAFNTRFAKRGWQPPRDLVCYRGWHSPRGAGFDVWYSPTDHIAYISAAYW